MVYGAILSMELKYVHLLSAILMIITLFTGSPDPL